MVKLPLTEELAKKALTNAQPYGVIHINHDIEDIHEFNNILQLYFKDVIFLPVDYKNGVTPSYVEIEKSIKRQVSINDSYIIIEDGGHFTRHAAQLQLLKPPTIHIEQTTRGERLALSAIETRTASHPIVSIARTIAKTRIENHFIAERILEELNLLMLLLGTTYYFRSCLVIGYGIIGRSVAHKLRARGCHVEVFDTSKDMMDIAGSEGFLCSESPEKCKVLPEIILGATGADSLSINSFLEISSKSTNLYLASASSGSVEFQSVRTLMLSQGANFKKDAALIGTVDNATVHLMADGRPVNFFRKTGESLPNCVADLINAQLCIALSRSMTYGDLTPRVYRVDRAPFSTEKSAVEICHRWSQIHGFCLERLFAGGFPIIGPHPGEDWLISSDRSNK